MYCANNTVRACNVRIVRSAGTLKLKLLRPRQSRCCLVLKLCNIMLARVVSRVAVRIFCIIYVAPGFCQCRFSHTIYVVNNILRLLNCHLLNNSQITFNKKSNKMCRLRQKFMARFECFYGCQYVYQLHYVHYTMCMVMLFDLPCMMCALKLCNRRQFYYLNHFYIFKVAVIKFIRYSTWNLNLST